MPKSTLDRPMSPQVAHASSEGIQRERLPVLIFKEPAQIALQVARRIANLVEERRAVNEQAVLGLPTGSTPIGVYQQLIRMHREDRLDLSNVIVFNLDEYFPMEPDSLQSYRRFMWENFFEHVNIPEQNIHIPRGDIPESEIEAHCVAYERAIEKAGGIDLMLLGIGRSGHIGFNEPGSSLESRTRLVVLDEITRKDAASDFFGEENVPRRAITVGVGTILDAREIILMATGEHKGPIVRRAVEEEPTRSVTASYLQMHRNATFYVDQASASMLTRIATSWLVKEVAWDAAMRKRAVIWLSKKVGKAILRLDASDFFNHHLHALAHRYNSIDTLCREVFEDLRQRVVYQDYLFKKERVIVFSPHPDDDVISMGGMLDKLVRNDNDVLVAYMTNGSVAVFDADVRRYLQFLEMSMDALGISDDTHQAISKEKARLLDFLDTKAPGHIDIEEVQKVKAYIRYSEAVAAIEVMGLGAEHARFLDMPFYKTGRVRKAPIGQADIQKVLDLLDEVQPDHIFVAGDLSDPHGTHRMCYTAIKEALARYTGRDAATNGVEAGDGEAEASKKRKKAPPRRPRVWLYRGAWQEWEIDRADVFIPLSKADLDRKVEAIFKHESQKDRAMFPGAYDTREFWQRAKDRNKATADELNQLGLPEFFAAEAFVTPEEMP